MPYAPPALLRLTEEVICRGDARKYTAFYATGYTVGCCLRCVFLDPSRDFP